MSTTVMSTAVLEPPSHSTSPDLPALPRFVARVRHVATPIALAFGMALVFLGGSMHDPGQDDDVTFVRLIGTHVNRWMFVHIVITAGWLLFGVGAGAVTRLIRGRGRVPFLVATPMLVVGALGWAFMNLTHGILAYALNGRTDVDLVTGTQVQLDYFDLPWTKAIVSLMLFAAVGVAVMGIGAIRSRLVPTWVGILLIVALVPVFLAPEGPVALLTGLPLVVGLAGIARAALKVESGL